jgi:hypothetical protein
MEKLPRKELEKLLKDVNTKALLKTIKQLDQKGRDIVVRGLSTQLNETKKNQLLSELRQAVTKADLEIRDWLVKSISESYTHGINYTTEVARIQFGDTVLLAGVVGSTISLEPVTVSLIRNSAEYSPHLSAINALLNDAYLDFGNSMTSFTRSGERMLNDALKRQLRSNIIQGRLDGSAIRDIKKTVKEVFVDKGFIGLTDRSGRDWTLDRYSEMLTRTHIIRANNEGAINRAKDFDVDIVEVSTHSTACPICQPYEGKFYSISGEDKKYPSLGGNEPPYHPNCKHSLLYRPDLGSDREQV